MRFQENSPPSFPTLDQQRDALQKGLGRALQWARARRLDEDTLLDACLHDRRFDHQCEDTRGTWYWQLIQAAGAERQFRVPILHALYEMASEDDADQLCELAYAYAATGDKTFRDLLYGVVERNRFPNLPCLGEYEIIELEGEQAFLFAAGQREKQLENRDWEWRDGHLVDEAMERFGEARVVSLLSASPTITGSLLEGWRREQHQIPQEDFGAAHLKRMQSIPVATVLRDATGKDKCYWFRAWGRCADEASLQVVLDHLWEERDPKLIANLLKVFLLRALPEFDSRLIALARHSDEDVERWALKALKQNQHPLVRKFALEELGRETREQSPIGLFIRNYEPDDEHRILEAMELPHNSCLLHWLLMDVIQVLDRNPSADASQLGLICYATTPCENCRFDAARLLHKQQVAPAWLLEECRWDSGELCRRLVEPIV